MQMQLRCSRAGRSKISVHHWKPTPKNMDGAKPAVLKNVGATDRLQEGEPQQQADLRRDIERMFGELVRDLIGRVGDDGFAAGQHLGFGKEVAHEIQAAIIDNVAGDRHVAIITQDTCDRAVARRRLPYPQRK